MAGKETGPGGMRLVEKISNDGGFAVKPGIHPNLPLSSLLLRTNPSHRRKAMHFMQQEALTQKPKSTITSLRP